MSMEYLMAMGELEYREILCVGWIYTVSKSPVIDAPQQLFANPYSLLNEGPTVVVGKRGL
jgi:hypothetical protein